MSIETTWCMATLFLALILLAVSVTDVRHLRIPDNLSIPLLLVGLILSWLAPDILTPKRAITDHIIGALVAFLLFKAMGDVIYRRTGQEGLGLGDAKLFGAAGAWLGWQALPHVLLIASLGGLSYALALRRFRKGSEIAFGPWIAIGMFLVWVTSASLWKG